MLADWQSEEPAGRSGCPSVSALRPAHQLALNTPFRAPRPDYTCGPWTAARQEKAILYEQQWLLPSAAPGRAKWVGQARTPMAAAGTEPRQRWALSSQGRGALRCVACRCAAGLGVPVPRCGTRGITVSRTLWSTASAAASARSCATGMVLCG